MKRLILIALLILSLAVAPVSAFAASASVIDDADLLTDIEEAQLAASADKLRARGFDIVILTMTGDFGGKSVTSYADDYFDYNGYGVGADHTGVLLLINMTTRDVYVSTSGKAIRAFTDYGIDTLLDEITPYLALGEYADGFESFFEMAESFITAYENGTPVDVPTQSNADRLISAIPVCLIIGAVIALIVTLSLKRGMNTVRASKDAAYAVDRSSFNLSRQYDVYLYSRTRRIPRSDSSSGGSSTHRSSSGRSHGGGGRKF